MKHVRFAVWGWCEMDETVAFISRELTWTQLTDGVLVGHVYTGFNVQYVM